jgi:hypothetical protein
MKKQPKYCKKNAKEFLRNLMSILMLSLFPQMVEEQHRQRLQLAYWSFGGVRSCLLTEEQFIDFSIAQH